eukprot:10488649-Ditylum_brightwellii.AAC.1
MAIRPCLTSNSRIPRESWAGPEALHAEELTFWWRIYREGMGGLSFRTERVPQGFPHAQRKQHTAT